MKTTNEVAGVIIAIGFLFTPRAYPPPTPQAAVLASHLSPSVCSSDRSPMRGCNSRVDECPDHVCLERGRRG